MVKFRLGNLFLEVRVDLLTTRKKQGCDGKK
jgi:hypothetical protein